MQRIHWGLRWGAFAVSTFTLSLFFAGWREINTTGHWTGFALLSAGVLLTGAMLMLQGYWIYFEEKNKGTLLRTNKLFENIHAFLDARSGNRLVRLIQPVVVLKEEGNNK